jgi:hypothetical protein
VQKNYGKEFGPNNEKIRLEPLKQHLNLDTMKSLLTDSHSTSNWTKICQPQAMANQRDLTEVGSKRKVEFRKHPCSWEIGR